MTSLALVGILLLALALFTGARAARELTPEVRAERRGGRRFPLLAVRRHHFRNARGWRYWQWTRALLLAWTALVLLWAIRRLA